MSGNHENSSSPIRAVIFDYGQVLCSPPDDQAIGLMASLLGVTPERFGQLYAVLRKDYDIGDLTAEQYWALLADQAGTTLAREQVDQLRKIDVKMWGNIRESMLRWAAALRSNGIKTAVLSNMHGDMAHYVRTQTSWLANFDCIALSTELRLAKPDAAIYHYCLERLGVAPHEALFLDDREQNVAAAQALGMKGIVAKSTSQIREELQAMGFLPLPAWSQTLER